MPPRGAHGSVPKSKKKKSEGATAKLIDILKPGSDENIKLRDSIPVVELDKIDSPCRSKVIPSSDTQGPTVPDEEVRIAAEVLQTLNKQQPGAGHHLCSTQSTPPGKAEYFEGGGLMRNIQESVKRHKMCNSLVSKPPTPITPAGSILTIIVGILSPAKVLAEDFTKATIREGSPNILKVTQSSWAGKLLTNQLIPMMQIIRVDPRTTQRHPPGRVFQLHAQVHLALVEVQQAAVVKVLVNQSRKLPTSPWWSQMTMISLMIPIRLYPLSRSSQFQPFPERISRDSMKDTFYQQR